MKKIIQAPLKKQYLIMKYNTPTFLLILGRIKKRQNLRPPIVTLYIYILRSLDAKITPPDFSKITPKRNKSRPI